MLHEPDSRVTPLNAERRVADAALKGHVDGDWTWLTPRPARVAVGLLSLHARPDASSAQVTEALHGEHVDILEDLPGGWAWVRTGHDAYLGYARSTGLTAPFGGEAVRVTAPRAHVFAAPKVSAGVLGRVSYGARLAPLDAAPVQGGEYQWWRVTYRRDDGSDVEGFVHAAATAAEAEPRGVDLDFARRFLDVPYLWGGRSAWGLDCSGLTQLVYAHAGRALPRDADQQEAFLTRVDAPRAGDLAFFPGHVGLMLNERDMLHANATHMRVTIDTLGVGAYGTRLAASLTRFGRWTPGGNDRS